MAAPNISRRGIFSCQVCVPKEFTDEEAIKAAESLYPCGTENGWFVVEEFSNGDPKRVQCQSYPENVHIVLTA